MLHLPKAVPFAYPISLLNVIRENSASCVRKHAAHSRWIVRTPAFSFVFAGNLLPRPVSRQPQDVGANLEIAILLT